MAGMTSDPVRVGNWPPGSPPAPTPQREPKPPKPPRGLNVELVCPHCLTKGQVTTRVVREKAGVSGGKATGAVLTAGFSLLATGLSRRRRVTRARCRHCGTRWSFPA